MKLMKRVMAVVLSGMMAASLAACGSGEGSSTTTTTAPAAADAATTAPAVEADTPAPAAPGQDCGILGSGFPGNL